MMNEIHKIRQEMTYLHGFMDGLDERIEKIENASKIKENTVTLGFNKLPVGLPPTKYQRVKLNGFDITDRLSCIDGDIGDGLNQKEEPSLAWLTFKDGLVVVCQRVCLEKLEKGEV